MPDTTRKYSVFKFNGDIREQVEINVVTEATCSIRVNGTELALLSCSPTETKYLAVGLVQSQGIIAERDDIKEIIEDNDTVNVVTSKAVDVPSDLMLTSSSGRSTRLLDVEKMKTESMITIPADRAFEIMEEFQNYSKDFQKTGGVHSAALYDMQKLLYFSEDVGRHNAIDKVFGRCLLEGIDPGHLFLVTSGRVSSDIMLKIARRRVPVFIARNSPTDLGVEMAEKAGITLLGFVRGTTMNAYTHAWRVK